MSAGLQGVKKCTLHVMLHQEDAADPLALAASKMKGSEYSFAPGSQNFKQSACGPATLERANSQAGDPAAFETMAASGDFPLCLPFGHALEPTAASGALPPR